MQRLQSARWLRAVLYGALFTLAFLFSAHKINLVTGDLGRHLVNGQRFVQHGEVGRTNTYSYTQPEFPVVTHHWGSGVVFYAVAAFARYLGQDPWVALGFLYAALCAAAVLLVVDIARQASNLGLALALGAGILPLLAFRAEVRPEGFSYALLGAFAWLLHRYCSGRLSKITLWTTLAGLQLLWVNLHLFFALGPAMVGAFVLQAWFSRNPQRTRELALALAITAVACLFNPWFLWGALQPFTILNEYGYTVAENKSIPFMFNRQLENSGGEILLGAWPYLHTFFLTGAILLACVALLVQRAGRQAFAGLATSLALLGLAYAANRAIALLALGAIPVLGAALAPLKRNTSAFLVGLAIALSLAAIALTQANAHLAYTRYRQGPQGTEKSRLYLSGLGILENKALGVELNACANFLKTHRPAGPIFNNYDIGGYLIYHLYPRYRVFVDNRPEAYSVSFLQDTLVKMQADEPTWDRLDATYRFNLIVFFRLDMTPWGQAFLVRRARDPEWLAVHIDAFTIVFARAVPQNQALLEQFAPIYEPMLRGN